MDILGAVAIELRCSDCGTVTKLRSAVTPFQIDAPRRLPSAGHFVTECPPPYYADLLDRESIEDEESPANMATA